MLGIVVKKERAELEEQKDQLVKSIASGKKKLEECEDEILRFVFLTKALEFPLFCYILTDPEYRVIF